jgi:myo-inositol-1(or 4)-monophosphatase
MDNEQLYLNTAVAVIKKAGKIFKKNLGKPKEVMIKNHNPRDMVTEVDKNLEKFIKNVLHKKFSDHDILGEESGLSDFKKSSGYRWFIDPVDGTTNYIQGLPICCISIALWDNKGPLVGVVYNPTLNYLFTARRGHGAFLNNKPIHVSNKSALMHAYGGFGWGRDVHDASANFPKLIKILNKIRTLGSSTLELCYVACGIYDFHIQTRINIWDFGAAVLMITEAGGNITDWKGNRPTPLTTNLISCNPQLFKALLKETKKLSQ